MTKQLRPFKNLQEIVDAQRGLGVADDLGQRLMIEGMSEGRVFARSGQGFERNRTARAAMKEWTWPDGDAFGVEVEE